MSFSNRLITVIAVSAITLSVHAGEKKLDNIFFPFNSGAS